MIGQTVELEANELRPALANFELDIELTGREIESTVSEIQTDLESQNNQFGTEEKTEPLQEKSLKGFLKVELIDIILGQNEKIIDLEDSLSNTIKETIEEEVEEIEQLVLGLKKKFLGFLEEFKSKSGINEWL